MSPYLNIQESSTFVLPPDDVAAIQDIYGVNENYESTVSDLPLPDYPESVPPTRAPIPTPSPSSTIIPDTCDTSYDAISVIRRGVYIFRGKYFWRVDEGQSISHDPVELSRFWYCLPPNVTRVDAVYERANKENIVFFSGRRYYVCQGNDHLVETGPLKRLGLPDSLEKIDAAFVWGHNTRTYFMADTMYWKFDESINHIELDYPRDIGMWKGIPYEGVDSAFKYNGTTYFFKGKVFWEFDDLRMKVRPKSPVLSAPFWMGCPDNVANPYHVTSALSVATSHLLVDLTLVVLVSFVLTSVVVRSQLVW